MSETWKKQSGWTDDDGGDDTPHIGGKVLRWFGCSLDENYESKVARGRPDAGLKAPVIQWYKTNAANFVAWNPVDQFHGRGYASGSWTIDWEAVAQALTTALAEIRAESFTSLDDWLRDDMSHRVHPYVGEAGDDAILTNKERRELVASARSRRKRWPRVCVDCDATFRAESSERGKGRIRCESCNTRRRRNGRGAK